jgi:hypothetical protein
VLAQALQRDPDDLRKRTLTLMVKEGVLRTAYPSMTNPRQAIQLRQFCGKQRMNTSTHPESLEFLPHPAR